MVGLVVVSHSHLVAIGLQEMAVQISQSRVKIEAAGGVDEQTIGTNAGRIYRAIKSVYSPDGVLILFDIGSALFSTQMAIEMFPLEQQTRIKVSNAHLVEGTMAAAIEAALARSLEEVNAAAEAVKEKQKIL